MSLAARLRVLIVEDNELDARAMIKSLSSSPDIDFEIVRVSDLESAVGMLERSDFDCILLDLTLPDSVGLVSVEVLSEHVPSCPIVVLSGLDDPAIALEAVERGAQDYLVKQRADPETVARSIRYAVARQHGEIELRSATAQLDLLRDRERIARDLHDTVIQQLFATGLGLESTAAAIADPDTRGRVRNAVQAIDNTIRQLREAIFGLHAIPQDLALAQALTDLAEEKAGALGFLPIIEVGALPEDLPVGIRHEAVQIVSEGLSNVVKHARASATIVSVDADGDELLVAVTDNGRGVEASRTDPAGPSAGLGGRGLRNMQERADSLEGRFRIGPGPGGGTRIEWRVPLRPG